MKTINIANGTDRLMLTRGYLIALILIEDLATNIEISPAEYRIEIRHSDKRKKVRTVVILEKTRSVAISKFNAICDDIGAGRMFIE